MQNKVSIFIHGRNYTISCSFVLLISKEKPNWLQQVPPKDYDSLLLEIKNGKIDDIIRKMVGLLRAEGDKKLKRKIRNFVRSFIVPTKKVVIASIS